MTVLFMVLVSPTALVSDQYKRLVPVSKVRRRSVFVVSRVCVARLPSRLVYLMVVPSDQYKRSLSTSRVTSLIAVETPFLITVVVEFAISPRIIVPSFLSAQYNIPVLASSSIPTGIVTLASAFVNKVSTVALATICARWIL